MVAATFLETRVACALMGLKGEAMSDTGSSEKLAVHPYIQRECDRLRPKLKAADLAHVKARHELGSLVQRIVEGASYGEDAIGQIQSQLGYHPRTLYRWATVAAAWPTPELEALVGRHNRHGLPLTWAHFDVLADLPPKRRLDVAERALTESLSARELDRLLHGPGLRVVGASAPENYAARVTRITRHTEKLLETAKRWEAELEQLPERRTLAVKQSLRKARKSYEELRAVCEALIRRIDVGLE